jgi:hypothetical protein
MEYLVMEAEDRRKKWNAFVDKYLKAGLVTEQSPEFLGWIEEWIAGTVEMKVVRRRYLESKRRVAYPQANLPVPRDMSLDRIPLDDPAVAGSKTRDVETLGASDAVAETSVVE